MTWPGEILHQRHPELPYTTWDMVLDTDAWGDCREAAFADATTHWWI